MSTYTPAEAKAFQAAHGFDPRIPNQLMARCAADGILCAYTPELRDKITTHLWASHGAEIGPADVVAAANALGFPLPPEAEGWA